MAVSASAARRPLRRPADGSRAGGFAPGARVSGARAFRLSLIRAVPDASVRIALRVGLRVGVGRGVAAVGADPRGKGRGAWRGGMAPLGGQPGACVWTRSLWRFALRHAGGSRRLVRHVFQSVRWAVRTGSRKADQPAVEAAGREGRGRGGRPRSRP